MSRVVGIRSTCDTSASLTAGETPGPRTANGMPERLLIWLLLAEESVLAQEVAVVGEQEDPGTPQLAGLLQHVQDLPDLVIEVLELFELALEDPLASGLDPVAAGRAETRACHSCRAR